MNELQNSLFEAMQAFRDNAIQNSKGTITLECTITKVKDAGLGEYYVKYLENDFIAYANANVTYSVGDDVYILVPEGDFTKNKIILGMTNPQAGMYVSNDSETSTHFRVSDNLITNNLSNLIEMSSYGTTREDINPITSILPVNFAEYINEYIKTGHNSFELNFDAKTELAIEQQVGGNYGITLTLPLIAAAPGGTTEVVYKTYTLDVGNMLGNPYRFGEWSPQFIYFTIDDQYKLSSTELPTLSYYCYGFNQDSTKINIKDIKLKDVGFYVADVLSAEDIDGYCLKIKASEGNFFKNNYSSSNKKTLSLILKVNGKNTEINSNNSEIYWFIEDASIKTTDNYYYCNYGGFGWKCLNEKTYTIINDDGTISWDFINNQNTYIIERYMLHTAARIKCVVIYNGYQVSDVITLKIIDPPTTLELYSSNGNNIFLKNTGYVYLTERISTSQLMADTDLATIKCNWIRYDINGTPIIDEDDFFELVRNEIIIINSNYYIETEIRFPVNSIEELNYVYCTVGQYNSNNFELWGTSNITISTTLDLDYSLDINNDGIIYKYDSNGDSPAGTAYDGPSTSKITSIAPLTYTIRKISGEELTKEEYCYVNYKWIVPKQSLFKVTNPTLEDDDNYYFTGYDNLNHNINLTYNIEDRYNLAKSRGMITLITEYQGNVLTATADINFIKEGQSGSNGTAYSARLVFGGDGPATSLPYSSEHKLKFFYDTTNNVLYYYKNKELKLWSTESRKIYTRVWKDSQELTYGTDFTVKYSMFDPEVCFPFFDIQSVDAIGGCLLKVTSESNRRADYNCSILQAEIKVIPGNTSTTNSEQIIYAYYPLEIISSTIATNILPSLDGGFSEVMYASDGTNPLWDETAPFEIKYEDELFSDFIGDYYDIHWSYGNHLTIEEENSNIVKIIPDNKYDTGNSFNIVRTILELDTTKISSINNRIQVLQQNINNDRTNITNNQNTFNILQAFVTNYNPTNWLADIDAIKIFLVRKFNYISSLSFDLAECTGNISSFISLRTEDFTNLESQIEVLINHVESLVNIVENMYLNKDYDDLYNLSTYKIAWSENIKQQYINTYGLNLTLQIEQLIINVNNQIDVCDEFLASFKALKYNGGENASILTDEDTTHLTDEDTVTLLDDAAVLADYLTIFRGLFTQINLTFSIETNYLNLVIQKIFEKANSILLDYFHWHSYIDFVDLFNILYDSCFKGFFNYNKITKVLTINDVTYGNISKNISDAQLDIDICNREIDSLTKIKNTENLTIIYIRPIVLYFNRYEMSNINAWDGNKIETGDGTYLLAPQVGAGMKENDNSFTGIVLGQRNLTNVSSRPEDNQIGMFGYSKGNMSLFLNARNGSAIFGKAGTGGQIIIDSARNQGMIYSSNFWSNYGSDLLPTSYSEYNESGHGLLIDFTNAVIRAGSHDDLNSAAAGFFLDETGLSIGSKFFVNAIDGSMRIGAGAVTNQTYGHFWEINTREDNQSSTGYESYIAFRSAEHHGNEKWDPQRVGQVDYAQVYIGTDGISLGNSFSVDKDGNLRIGGGGGTIGDTVGGWWIYDNYLASNNYKTSSGTDGIKLDSRQNYISLGQSNAKIYSGNHSTLSSTSNGFYLGHDGLSISSTFKIYNNGETTIHLNDNYSKIYSGTHSSFSSTTDGFYLGSNGISIGNGFRVDDEGNGQFSGQINSESGNIGGWEIHEGYLCSENYGSGSNGGIGLFSEFSDAKICSGTHTTLDSTSNGFYLGHDGISIGDIFKVWTDSQTHEPRGTIGDSEILRADNNYSVNHSNHTWKLRSAAIDSEDTNRFYAYLTSGKHFIVSNDELGGHTEQNDVTDDCSIGSPNYPWGRGFFKNLYIYEKKNGVRYHHNVIPEGISITLTGGEDDDKWYHCLAPGGYEYYRQQKNINLKNGNVYLYIATDSDSAYELVYKYNIEVDIVTDNIVTFSARSLPTEDIDIILLCEDFIRSEMEQPYLTARFDQEKNQLFCQWDTPRDSSKFITWIKDELVIEKCIDEDNPDDDESWEQVLVVPTDMGGTPFQPDQYSESPLIVGSTDEGE